MAGQIINRGENVWLVRIFMGRDDKGKKRYHNKTIHGNKKAAQQYLNEKLREKDLGIFVQPSRESSNKYLDKWLETAAKPRVREKTFKSYEELLRLYIRPHLGDIKISELTPLKIQDTYNKLTEQGLSPRTVRYAHSVLRDALEQAVKWQMLTRNPCQHVDLPKNQKKEMTILTAGQAKTFLEAAKESKWYPLFSLLLASGMRPGEALGLRWPDIDFDQGRIHVQRALSQTDEGRRLLEPKTAKGRRVIPLPKSVLADLKAHRKAQLEEQMRLRHLEGFEQHNLVFASANGKPVDHNNLVSRHFKPILVKAELPNIRLYDLRHTCATLLLLAGVNPKIVSERLGHASVTLTLDTYSHVLPDMQQSAADKLEKLLF